MYGGLRFVFEVQAAADIWTAVTTPHLRVGACLVPDLDGLFAIGCFIYIHKGKISLSTANHRPSTVASLLTQGRI
ncbi:hypothetical protein M3J09_009997 [Ascochyta lentis]